MGNMQDLKNIYAINFVFTKHTTQIWSKIFTNHQYLCELSTSNFFIFNF